MLDDLARIAEDAGRTILKYYKTAFTVEAKDDGSPLSIADREANQLIVNELEKLNPMIPIVSEESEQADARTRAGWGRFWLVDPLDGTAEFINGLDDFTVNIALINGGVPVTGVVYAPALGAMYMAEQNKGAWSVKNGGPKQRMLSKDPDWGGPYTVAVSRRHASGEVEKISQVYPVKSTVPAGSSLKFCLVAEGAADLYPRLGPTMEWDVAAGDCIYRNSALTGARFSSLTYNKPTLRNGPFVIGASEAGFKKLLDLGL